MKKMIAFLAFTICTVSLYAQSMQPHIRRTGPNLVKNPSIAGADYWDIHPLAEYDSSISRTPGSGSLKLVTLWPEGGFVGGGWTIGEYSGFIPVTPGKTYTVSCYIKSNTWPTPAVSVGARFFDAGKNVIGNRDGVNYSVSAPNEWQECVALYTAKPGDAYILVGSAMNYVADSLIGDVWLDDFYFGEGAGFEQPPSRKKTFNSSYVHVDELGNFEVQRNGMWVPFFPLCIYGDDRRSDFTVYSNQGFNTNMWANDSSEVRKAKNAVSDFNPDGMMSGLDISLFMYPEYGVYERYDLLRAMINEVKAAGLMSNVLLYYWDNETGSLSQWRVPDSVATIIRELDIDGHGNQAHPIYALNTDEGVARKYNNNLAQMIDITGSYVTKSWEDRYGEILSTEVVRGAIGSSYALFILDNIEQQQSPMVFVQLNNGIGLSLRPRLYNAISKGARGMGFWSDCVNTCFYETVFGTEVVPPVETQPWWPDFPNLRREIDQMLPLIRQPHWTSWRLTSFPDSIAYGTRDFQGEGYVIVANETENTQTTTFTISDLQYVPEIVEDFFTGNMITPVSGSSFTITLPRYGTGVYRLKNASAARSVRVVSTEAYPGDSVNVAIKLVAEGNESAIAFSFNFDKTILNNPRVRRGSGGSRFGLSVNCSDTDSGQCGVILLLPPGQTLTAGEYEILVFTFDVDPNTLADSTVLTFGDQPVVREISDPQANALHTDWLSGTVRIIQGYECDLAPRPYGTRDGRIAVTDLVQFGRFVIGWDTIRTDVNEFQRADCEPAPCGNGQFNILDWARAIRYALGLDSAVRACGPTDTTTSSNAAIKPPNQVSTVENTLGARTVRIANSSFEAQISEKDTVFIVLESQGDEIALRFSLNFDPAILTYDTSFVGKDAKDATLFVNDGQVRDGRLGVALAFFSGQAFPVGTREILAVVFSINRNDSTSISFGDQPVAREIADINATLLTANWVGASIITAVDEIAGEIPLSFELLQNYPNPFNPETSLSYALPKPAHVVLQIYDILGRQVRTLVNETKPAGHHYVTWNGRDAQDLALPSGIYLYKIQAGEFEAVRKMLLAK